MKDAKIFYRRNLPHIQPIGASFFVTCSLKGAIPKSALQHIKEQYNEQLRLAECSESIEQQKMAKYEARRKYLLNIDDMLHTNKGPAYLADADIARILLARIESYHMRYYRLLALTIMPNHFHMLIDTSIQIRGILEPDTVPNDYVQLDKIMQLIKGGSARYINQRRSVEGEQVWENESFDVYIRDERMLNNVVNYILNNPVKAGLAKSHEDHPFTFSNDFV